MNLLDGKQLSTKIKNNLAFEISSLKSSGLISDLGLAVILVGNDPASAVYVRNKINACAFVGITSIQYNLDESVTEHDLIALIEKLNADSHVTGILVQLPLPKHISENAIISKIDPSKDVDGFTPYQTGLLSIGQKSLVPCTPKGIIALLEHYNINLSGAHAVIVGRSNIVGKPLMNLLLQKNSTVTICHSKTKNLADITKTADILIVAIGKPKFITETMIKDGAVLIDVGINRVDGKLVGDVDFEHLKEKCSYITPVPGGVGPMTITMLLQNTLEAYHATSRT
jgi:methylenetetrahydrofolate dehydrogenase (NADP+)/methenyltetrahydrofolate cyclohydrolase